MTNGKSALFGCAAGITICGSIALLGLGPIDPPAGAVQPTMHSIDEVYGLLEAQATSAALSQWEVVSSFNLTSVTFPHGSVQSV